jgi:hypothetical protein
MLDLLSRKKAPEEGRDRGHTNLLAQALRHCAELARLKEPGGAPDTELTQGQLGPCFHLLLQAGLVRVLDNGPHMRLTELGQGLLEFLEGCNEDPDSEQLPSYDVRSRILRWRGEVAKRLARKAPCQETVLQAFHMAGWPERIADPLGEELDFDPKERLRETVKSLNKGLAEGTIRFRADGTGRGVRWEVAGTEKVGSSLDHP